MQTYARVSNTMNVEHFALTALSLEALFTSISLSLYFSISRHTDEMTPTVEHIDFILVEQRFNLLWILNTKALHDT